MIIIKKLIKSIGLYFMFMPNAWAYIDPGSGIMLLQGIIAAIGAIIIFIKNPIESIKDFIRWIKKK